MSLGPLSVILLLSDPTGCRLSERRAYKANRVNNLVGMTQTHAWQKKTSGSFSSLNYDVDILNVSDSILMSSEDAADFLLQAPEVRSLRYLHREKISPHFIRK